MITNNKNKTSGFTLVEALVAISILMVAVASPMVIAQKGLNSANYSRDQMTATFLAEDAVEFIKNFRDYVGLNQDPHGTAADWINYNGDLTLCMSPNLCNIDTTFPMSTIISSPTTYIKTSSSANPLKISRATSGSFLKYDLSGNQNSKFTREIQITRSSSGTDSVGPDEALVYVRVSWQSTTGTEEVILQNYIYNYWENL